MPDLASFQREFATALMADGETESSVRSHAFAVYRNTSARGAVEALRASYPTVDMLIGEDMFTATALDFRRHHPPRGPVLSDYGADFAAFLAKQPWTCELPYLADVARLDRLWLESFLAPDAVTTARSFGQRTRTVLHPATRIAWLQTPAMTIWQAHRDPWTIGELEPEWVEEGALFTRQGRCIRAEQLDPVFYSLLAASAAATPVSDLVQQIAARFPTANIPELLQRGVAAGALLIL